MHEARARLEAAGIAGAEWALVLGTGLSEHGGACGCDVSIPTGDLAGFGRTRVQGHPGRVELRRYGGAPVLTFAGRSHLYEGCDLGPVVAPALVAAELGIAKLVLVSAIGGISTAARSAGFVAVDDYLIATPNAELDGVWELPGKLAPAETQPVFDATLVRAVEYAARAEGIAITRGVYAWCRGPQFETAAEIRVLAGWGADGVGMSMVPEAIAARRMGLAVAGIGVVTNAATGLSETPHDHLQVNEVAEKKATEVAHLLTHLFSS